MIISDNFSEVCAGSTIFIFPNNFRSEIFDPYLNKLDSNKKFSSKTFGEIIIGVYDPDYSLKKLLTEDPLFLQYYYNAVVVCPQDVNEVELLAFANTELKFIVSKHKLDRLQLLGEFIC